MRTVEVGMRFVAGGYEYEILEIGNWEVKVKQVNTGEVTMMFEHDLCNVDFK
jgi:hypothetical protein